MSNKLSVTVGQSSLPGIKSSNEDNCGIVIPTDHTLDSKGIAVVIADGVSSSIEGKEASSACVKGFLTDYYSTPESWTTKTSAQKILGALNRWLYGRGIRQHGSAMGYVTTLSTLVLKSTTAHIFHVGDTRIHRYSNGDLESLTQDQHVVSSGNRTFLSNAMGVDPYLEIQYFTVNVEEGDLFILTTDGVHEFIDHKALREQCKQYYDSPEVLSAKLTSLAINNNSDDNVTAQAVRIDNLPFHKDENEFYRQLTELPFPQPFNTNQEVDGYRIIREIHASKRTQVYLAEDLTSQERVVIKTPSINYEDDAEYIDRFLNEEWVGRRINNQHVLKVLNHPRKRSSVYYLTEYTEGQTLRQWMQDNPSPSLIQLRPMAEQIMRGILAFHRLEMVHQDLKPENIMIDNEGTIKIIDFGSTRIAGVAEIKKPIGEAEGILGTVNYTAPELYKNPQGTQQSDLFSFGVIIYEMLTGKLPYGDELSVKQLQRAEYERIRKDYDEIPFWVDQAIHKAVHKDPNKRYESISEFVVDLNKPNKAFTEKSFEPLIEKNPLALWKSLAILSLILNLVLIYILVE